MLQTYRTVLPVTNANLIAFRMYYEYYSRDELATNKLGQFARRYVNDMIRKAIHAAKESCGNRFPSDEYMSRVHREALEMIASEIDYYETGGYTFEPEFDIAEHLIRTTDSLIILDYPTHAETEEHRYD